ncbi:M48 family metallopeptidase [Undibacterium sp. TJN25]|uniref:M48 family metallopeptidase n=1 Tax=Undibacterium sp. TJN25 TaxID=3413056 RepID=UPI003BF29B6E
MKNTFLLPLALAVALLCSSCMVAMAPALAPALIQNVDMNKVMKSVQGAQDAVTDMTDAQEVILGQQITSNLLSMAPLLQNQRAQRYVNSVGRWLALQTDRPDLPWTFAVLDDPEINAFATPGGYVVVTRGLLIRMKSEAELAGVLAHEMSHVLKKHHLIAIRKAAGINVATDLLTFGAEKKAVSPELIKWATAGTELYTRGLDQDDELEADRMGVVIAARAGYDPYGLPAVLQTLEGMNPADPGLSLLFRTHPSLSSRLNALDTVMTPGFERFDKLPNVPSRFVASIAGVSRK